MKSERDGINPAAEPSGTGCVECLALGGWWFHLRRCAECGHIGCCDSSPNQHASKHYAATGHPIITSFEPGERWFYDYRTEEFLTGPKLSLLTHIRWINRRPDRPERCLQIGKRCFTNRGRLGSAASRAVQMSASQGPRPRIQCRTGGRAPSLPLRRSHQRRAWAGRRTSEAQRPLWSLATCQEPSPHQLGDHVDGFAGAAT